MLSLLILVSAAGQYFMWGFGVVIARGLITTPKLQMK
ncbi:phosphoethanolamine transferase domain-containing protein [Klebsiella quasipneumoniae]